MSDDPLRQIARESTDGTAPRLTLHSFKLESINIGPLPDPWQGTGVFPLTVTRARQQHDGALWQEKALGKATRRATRLWSLVRRGVLADAEYRQAMQDIRRRYGIEG